jgi:hypothetical protein
MLGYGREPETGGAFGQVGGDQQLGFVPADRGVAQAPGDDLEEI